MDSTENIVFNPQFKEKKEILFFVSNFRTSGQAIKEKRNVLKRVEYENKNYIIKSFKRPHLLNQLIYKLFRPSKAKRSYRFAMELLNRGINTPEPIAYIEKFDKVGLRESFYICEEVEYDLTFRELIHDPDYPDRERILRQFAAFTFKLHERNILFLDHSPGNTLIVKNQGNYDFYLVDLNRMKILELDFDMRMKNFVRLYPSPDMIRIMSDEYSELYGKDSEIVYLKMRDSFNSFKERYERRKNFTRPLKKLLKK